MVSGKPTLYLTSLLCALGFMLIGYDNGVMGGIINGQPFKDTFPDTVDNETLLGTIVAIYEIGCCVGAITCAIIGEKLGRRMSVLLGAVVMLGGAGFQAGVSSSGPMIAARVVSGLGMGFINSTVPVLQTEVAPSKHRGRFICFALTLLNLGIMLAYWTGYGFGDVTGSKAWRIPVAIQCVFIIPIILLVFIVPESPRWLASHGKSEQALSVISRLMGKPATHDDVMAEYAEISAAVEYERAIGSGNWSDLFKSDNIQSSRRLLIACSVQFFQQIGGINALIYYMGNFLALVSSRPDLLAGAVFTWFFVASFIPWFLIDSWGRRRLLLYCITGMAACFAIQAGLVAKVSSDGDKSAGGAATAFMFVYMGLFTIGFQAVVWVYPSEVLPLRLRQKGSSISTAVNWLTNYAIVQITPIALKSIGYKFYIVFACINFAFLPPIYFFYPETKGLSLEKVDLLFSKNHAQTFEEAKQQSQHIDIDSDADRKQVEEIDGKIV